MNCLVLLVAFLPVARSAIDTSKIDSYLNAIMECSGYKGRIGGMTISGVKDGQVVYRGNFGHASIKDNKTFSNQTRFSIGSLSKSFTSYIVSSLVKQSKLEWKGVITDYFHKYKVPFQLSGAFRNSRCTIKDAMTHQTGIKSYDILLGDNRTSDRSEWVRKVMPYFSEEFEFRDMFYYNNWMYTLVGYLTEVITGTPWEDQVRDKLLTPLNMNSTTFVSDADFEQLEDIATPYNEDKHGQLYEVPLGALKLISVNAPAGGMVSTSVDMSTYLINILAAHNNKNKTLDPEVLAGIVSNKVYLPYNLGHDIDISKPTFPETYTENSYGIGILTGNYRGYKQYNHGGSAYGHYSFMMLLPDMDIGVFAFVSGCDQNNDNWKILRLIMLYVTDVLLEVEPWLNDTTVCSYPHPWLTVPEPDEPFISNTSEGHAGEKYVGVYKRREYQDLIISVVDEQLQLKMGNVEGVLNYTKHSTYISYLEVPWFPKDLKGDSRMLASVEFVTDEVNTDKVTELSFIMGLESFVFRRSNAAPIYSVSILLVLALLTCWHLRDVWF